MVGQRACRDKLRLLGDGYGEYRMHPIRDNDGDDTLHLPKPICYDAQSVAVGHLVDL